MSELVHIQRVALPADPRYRPSSQGAYSTRVLGGLTVLVGAGMLLGSGGLGAIGLVGFLTAEVAALSWLVGRRRRLVRSVRESDEAVALLNGGNVPGAAQSFERLIDMTRDAPFYNALVIYNRAVTYLQEGYPEQALSMLSAVAQSRWFDRFDGLYKGNLWVSVATAYVILGDVHAAGFYAERARASLPDAKKGMVMPVDALIRVRAGDPIAALQAMDAGWFAAEAVMPALAMRRLGLVRAFALRHIDRTGEQEAEMGRLIANARPYPPFAYGYLAVRWPELQRFLHEHGLDR